MTIRNLDHLFRPASLAIIGASPRDRSLGNLILRNVIGAGFMGPVFPVNPRHHEIEGLTSYASVADLPQAPDLAVICTPPATVPGLIRDLAARGTRAGVVITAGLSDMKTDNGKTLQTAMLEAARPHLFRILGPNCLGLLVPGVNLNASFAHLPATPGGLAFVSQSGGLCTAMLDWAQSRGIGFSHMISLGNSADIDLGDAIDYLARDESAKAIVLYIEAVTHARKFMSAARAAARAKPVIAIKAGRAFEGARAAHSHTGAMSGADNVYDAAIRRSGMLRVFSIDELFDAVETLSHVRHVSGDRLAIMTNGGGPGVLAADAVAMSGGHLAALSDETLAKLDSVLPATWSRANPIDIIGDATPDRFRATAEILTNAPELDAVLFAYAPTAISDSIEIARATAPIFQKSRCPVFANWLGGAGLESARHVFEEADIPTFDTPERAGRSFLNLIDYRRNQLTLLETPIFAANGMTDHAAARAVMASAAAQGRTMLNEPEAKAVLSAYGIPTVKTATAASTAEAVELARAIGYPVALKLLSRDISHKSDVGGVVLDVETESDLRAAAESIQKNLAEHAPTARLDGFSVQQMIRKPGAFEIIIGAATDPTFGPTILFGQGGTATEIIKDLTIGLPPLNSVLARDMISRTRISKLLAGYRNVRPVDLDELSGVLVQLSQLIIDCPEIAEIDINPLLADADGMVALDARIKIDPSKTDSGTARLAILPYPRGLEDRVEFDRQPLVIRPIRPEDEAAHRELISRCDPEDVRLRFFGYQRSFSHEDLARLTQIDYDREMAFVATAKREDGTRQTLGVVRAVVDPDNIAAEFAILIDTHLKHHGLGTILMHKLIDYLKARKTTRLEGQILTENDRMLQLARALGFTLTQRPGGIQNAVMNLG